MLKAKVKISKQWLGKAAGQEKKKIKVNTQQGNSHRF